MGTRVQEDRRSTMPWAMLSIAFLLVFAMSVPMFCVPPMEHIIKEKLLLSHAQTSLLFTAPLIGMAALAIPGGMLADRIGIKKAAGIGTIIIAIGTVLRGITNDYATILAFTLIVGVGSALIFPNLPKLVSQLVPRNRFGAATGIYAAATSVSNAIAVSITLPLIFPITGTFQGTFLIWSIPAIIAVIVWWTLAKDPLSANTHPEESVQSRVPFREILRNRSLWLVAILFFLHNIFFTNWIGWAPTLMQEKGATAEVAALIASVTMWIAIPTVIFMPRLSDRLGLRKPFLWVSSSLLALASFWAIHVSVPLSWLIMALVGLSSYSRFVTVMVLQAEILPKQVGLASGFILSIGFTGGVIGTWIGGYTLDVTGSLNLSLLILMGISIATAIIALNIPETGSKVSRVMDNMLE